MAIMKTSTLITLLVCLVACLFAGCADQDESELAEDAEAASELVVTITSPKTGAVASGNDEIEFDSSVEGGKKPYTYRWSSGLAGEISMKSSFKLRSSDLDKGRHVVILSVTDAAGQQKQASVIVTTL